MDTQRRHRTGTEHVWPSEVLDALPVSVGEVDAQGRLIRANGALLRLFDLDDAALHAPGFDMHSIDWPTIDNHPGSLTILRALLDGHHVDGIFDVPLSGGTRIALRVSGAPTPRTQPSSGAVMVLAEITSSTAEYRAAAAQGAAYRLLAEHLGDLVLVSQGSVITWVSPSVRQLLGYEPDQVIGRTVMDFVHCHDRTDLKLTPEAPTMSVRCRVRRADGEYRWFDSTLTARFTEDGTVAAIYSNAHDVDAQVRVETLLHASEQRMREALDASPDGFAVYHAERDDTATVTALRLIFINAAGAAGFAGDPDTLAGHDLLDFYPEAALNGLHRDMVTALDTGLPQRSRIETVGDSWTGVLDGVQVRLEADSVLSTWRDVTELLHGERLLAQVFEEAAEVRATLQTALDATSDAFAVFDLQRDEEGAVTGLRAVHTNSAASHLLGMATGACPDLVAGTGIDLLEGDPREWLPLFREDGFWDKVLASVAQMHPREHRVHLGDSSGQWTSSWDATIAPVGTDRVVLTWRDVTIDERERRDQDDIRRRAEHSATHDALTGLPNRLLLRRRLEEALRHCSPGERVGVVFCDLDGFKNINDTHGHAAGDEVLKATAQRLRTLLRKHDTPARLAGDEFVLLLRHVPQGWDSDQFRARAADRLAEPVWFEATALTPSASIGIVLADPHTGPDTDRNLDALLAAADRAMYRHKTATSPSSSGTETQPTAGGGPSQHI